MNALDLNQPGMAIDESYKGYFRSTLEGKFLEVNRELADIFGYDSRDELLQVDIARDLYIDPLQYLELLLELSRGFKIREMFAKCRDGRLVVQQLCWRRVFDDAGTFLYFEGFTRDVTESKYTSALLKILNDLAIKLSGTFDLHAIFNEVLQTAMKFEGVDCGAIHLYNDSSQVFESAASIGVPRQFIDSIASYTVQSPLVQRVMQGKTLYLTAADMEEQYREYVVKEGIKSLTVTPITYQGRVIAMLHVGTHVYERIFPDAAQAIESIALQIGGSIMRDKLKLQGKSTSNTCNLCLIRSKI